MLFAPIKERIKNPDRFALMFAPINRWYRDSYADIDLENLDLDYFVEMQQNINKLKTEISGVLHSLKEQIKQNNRRVTEISSHISNLNRGVKNYDQRLLTLKRILEQKLSQKYSRNVQVDILSDLLEVKNPSWKNAIEGYLHTQKFYLFIDPIYFEDALKIYDEIKFEYNLYDFGIVDCLKVKQSKQLQKQTY